ncbi:MAG: hypothetical protein QNL45_03365, partial [Nitrospirota bacterium]|nr:hypothetical protein [Nitrospirota bacterium]
AAQAAADQLAADQAAQAAADQLAADQAAAQAAADAAAAAPPPGPNESGFPASPGNPTVILESSTVAMDTPFLLDTSGSSTIDGPPVILVLENFSGSTSNIPLSAVGNVSPSVASDLLSAFGDPDNPGSLLAGIRTQNTSSEQATILGGIALQNTTVDASVDVAQFDNANVAIGGSFLELDASTLNGGDLFGTSGQNTITSGDDFITVDQGTLNAFRVSGNPSNISLTINNGGFLTLTNSSNVSITNGFGFVFRDITSASTFVSVDNSQLEMGLTTDGVLARLSESFVVNSGGVLEVNNSGEVSVSSIIRGAGTTLSSGILNGTAIVVNNQSSVIANQAVKLENLVPTTDLSLTVNNGGVLSLSNGSNYVDAQLVAASSPLVELVQSSMSTGSGFIDVNSGSTLEVPNDALVSLDASQLVVNGS